MVFIVSVLETEEERERMDGFFQTWGRYFYRTARRIMGNPEDAEDILMLALERLMENYQYYHDFYTQKNQYRLAAIVNRFVRQFCADEWERRDRMKSAGERLCREREAEEAALRAGPVSPLEEALIQTGPLREALKALEPEDKLLITMVYVSQYTKAEAGRLMGLDEEKTKTRLRTLLRRLSWMLMEVGYHE